MHTVINTQYGRSEGRLIGWYGAEGLYRDPRSRASCARRRESAGRLQERRHGVRSRRESE